MQQRFFEPAAVRPLQPTLLSRSQLYLMHTYIYVGEPSGQNGDKSSALAGQGTCSTLHDTPAGRPVVCWWSNAVHQNTRRVYVVLEMAEGPAPHTAGERADRRPKPPAKPNSI